MKENDRITLTKEKREDMVTAIKAYYKEEREEEIGQLAAGMLLDFVIEELAPEFYNQGVLDSCKYLSERIEDMQSLLL
jgi:uncharacterized protein (DUF2164 family)